MSNKLPAICLAASIGFVPISLAPITVMAQAGAPAPSVPRFLAVEQDVRKSPAQQHRAAIRRRDRANAAARAARN